MYESAKQCQRGDLARINNIISFDELLKLDGYDLRVLCSEKKADMTMRSLIIAAYTIKKEGLFNLKIAGQLPNYTNHLRIGVTKDEPMLRDILNKGIVYVIMY